MADNIANYRQPGLGGPGYDLFMVAIGLTVAVLLSLSVRLYSKNTSRRGVELDDYMIMAAAFFDIVMASITVVSVYYGFGNPGDTLAPNDEKIALQMFWLTQIFYKVIICLTKVSFLIFYFNVFPQSATRWFRLCDYGIMAYVIAYSIASIFATIGQCIPIWYVWDKSSGVVGKCINTTAFWYTNAVASISSDVMIIGLPCSVCYTLKISRRSKVGLFLIFSVGIFVIGTSITRFTTLDMSSKSRDQTAGSYQSTVWTVVEANTAIICACLPAFKRPFKELFIRIFPGSKCARNESSRRSGFEADGRDRMLNLGEIAVRTDVDVRFEPRSREASTIGSREPKAGVEAREIT